MTGDYILTACHGKWPVSRRGSHPGTLSPAGAGSRVQGPGVPCRGSLRSGTPVILAAGHPGHGSAGLVRSASPLPSVEQPGGGGVRPRASPDPWRPVTFRSRTENSSFHPFAAGHLFSFCVVVGIEQGPGEGAPGVHVPVCHTQMKSGSGSFACLLSVCSELFSNDAVHH